MKRGDLEGLILLGGVLLIFIGLWFGARSVSKTSVTSFGPVEVTGTELALTQANSSEITFSASMMAPGFVTLHEAMGDIPGSIVRTSELLSEGVHDVRFSSSASFDRDYIALVIKDDGDGVYEPGVDRPVMSNGVTLRTLVSW